jgi:tRNA pseudouridine55 synthase
MPRWTDGVVLLDKPLGISSQKAVTIVKHACGANKAGRTGTLDPLATGLLAVCLGEATKYSQDIFNADKTYITTIHFGIKTETGDVRRKSYLRSSL